jgi:PAS domain S-box-containing protein
LAQSIPSHSEAGKQCASRDQGHGTPMDEELEECLRLAACVCRTPVALLHLFEPRRWLAYPPSLTTAEVERFIAACSDRGTGAASDSALVVDAPAEKRSAGYGFEAGREGIEFCHSTALKNPDGITIGTLSVLDQVPRRLSGDQLEALRGVTRQVTASLARQHSHRRAPVEEPTPSAGTRSIVIELEQAERKNREQAALLDVIFEHSLDCIVLLDKHYNFIRVNKTYADLCQRDVSYFPGRNHFELYPSPLKEEFDEAIRNRLIYRKNERPFTFPDHPEWGTTYWDLGMVPIRDQAGDVEMLLFTLRDVTPRRRVDEERKRFVALADATVEFVGMCDLEFKPFYVNPAGLRLAGLTTLEAAKLVRVQDFFFPEDLPFINEEFFPRVIRDGHAEAEVRFRHFQTGEAIWMLYSVINLCDAKGERMGWATVSRDITQRKRMEAALRQSEERFRLVAEVTNDVLWDWDVATDQRWWSPNAMDKFGYDSSIESGSHAWRSRLHPDDRKRVLRLIERLMESGEKSFIEEYQFRLADGSYGYFLDKGKIVRDSRGTAVRMIGAMIDVTAAKHAYASLQKAYRRLQSMSQELQMAEWNERRRLSRELHDEVGQLLTALKFDLEAAHRAIGDKRPGTMRRGRAKVKRALETTDVLFARLRLVVRALRPPVLDNLGLKDALYALVADLQSRTGLMCSITVEAKDIPSRLTTASESALYRMAQELLTNAARHARATTVALTLVQEATDWVLTVKDDGIGFPPGFEASSNGMGLRGVRERAEISGGHVSIMSAPGAGTTVCARIPFTAGRVKTQKRTGRKRSSDG